MSTVSRGRRPSAPDAAAPSSTSSRCRSHSPHSHAPETSNYSFGGRPEGVSGSTTPASQTLHPPAASSNTTSPSMKPMLSPAQADSETEDELNRSQQIADRASFAKLSRPDGLGGGRYPGEENWPDVGKLPTAGIWSKMDGARYGMLGGKVLSSHEGYFVDPANLALLSEGGCLFSFTWRQPHQLTDYEKVLMSSIINLTSFKDERENGTIPFDVYNPEEVKSFTYLIQKASYLLPGIRLPDVTPKFLSTYAYMKNSQPASCYIWEDVTEENTFRLTKTVIRFVFSVTMQFKMSKVEESVLPHLSEVLGIRVDAAVLMERTRRTKNAKPDASAKFKSILCYTKVDGGLLCTNYTSALQYSVPTAVTALINSFGGRGLNEVSETAANTRKYLRSHFAQ